MSTEVHDALPDSLHEKPSQQAADLAGSQTEPPPENPDGKELGEDGKPKPMGGFQKRIHKLTSRLAAQEAEIAALKAAQTPAADRTTEHSSSPGKPEPPDESKFTDYSEFKKAEQKYFEDLADWKAEEKLNAREKAKAEADGKAKEQAKQEELKTGWNERLATAHEAHPDLEDLLETEDLPVSPAMGQLLMESEHGGELLYLLATNPEECRRLALLPPLAVAREFGRMEVSIVAATKAAAVEPKKTTSAPAPLQPVKGSGTVATDPSKLSDAEWLRAERRAKR